MENSAFSSYYYCNIIVFGFLDWGSMAYKYHLETEERRITLDKIFLKKLKD
ncbi:MAG: hypothetical protein ACQKHC_02135 [Candidatus Phytoplasma pruni]